MNAVILRGATRRPLGSREGDGGEARQVGTQWIHGSTRKGISQSKVKRGDGFRTDSDRR